MAIRKKPQQNQTAEQENQNGHWFKIRYLFGITIILLFVLSIYSFDKADLAVLEGGVEEPVRNWIGPLGAQVSRFLLYWFGLATYPLILFLCLVGIRVLIPVPRKTVRYYYSAVLAMVLGIVIFMAMWPERYIEHTDKLGIGRMERSSLALSGGVVGAFLASPMDGGSVETCGIIRRHIGEVGTLVVVAALFLPGLAVIYYCDWHSICSGGFSRFLDFCINRRRRREKEAEKEEDLIRKENEEYDKYHRAAGTDPEDNDNDGDINMTDPDDESDNNKTDTKKSIISGIKSFIGKMEQRPADEEIAAVQDDDDDAEEQMTEENNIDDTEETSVSQPVPAPVPTQIYSDSKEKFDREKPKRISNDEPIHRAAADDDAPFRLPPVSLLEQCEEVHNEDNAHIENSKERLQQTLESFNIDGRVSQIVVGPRVTRFEITLARGVKVEKVSSISGNIAMELSAPSIRILAPIPGMDAVGIEVPNKVSSIVSIRALMESSIWKESNKGIPIVLGRDISGKIMITDLAKAPHLLIAGSTGSGKSVCMNTLIMSLLFKFSPTDLRLILVDPKTVELEMYRPLPHLITPVVNDPKKVPLALRWGVNEMERRYKVLAKVKAKNLASFNSRPPDPEPVLDEDGQVVPPKLPLLVIIIDELADIMMTEAKKDVETSICRIAQKGRAAGIHLVIATQTPRKDIITGLIKANLPTKIAFRVGTNMDSRVILDASGAEKLLGQGDMLFKPPGADGLERIQGSMVSDPEIQKVVDFVSVQMDQHFDTKVVAEDVEIHNGESDDDGDNINNFHTPEMMNSVAAKYLQPGDSDLLRQALEIIICEQKVSTSYLQRRLGIGYNRSAELMDELEDRGIISAPLPGGQKREILITDGLDEE